jgi:nucleotide-binding universal stress UspA family protein
MPLVEAKTRITLKNILFPTDFSERSAIALPFAAILARRYGAKVYVVHAVSSEIPPVAAADLPPISYWKISEQEMAILDRSDLLRDVEYETVLGQGDLWEVLSHAITAYEVDLVVMATHGRGGFRRLILGSVAEEVVREALCPVMTIGPEVPSAETVHRVQHVLFATDFRPGSLAALMYAVFFAEENQADLTLLHVAEAPRGGALDGDEREKALHRLREMLPADHYLAHEPEFLVENGPASETILCVARSRRSDLLVVGARETQRHWVPSHFTWSTLHQILCDAACPVLSVRGKPAE